MKLLFHDTIIYDDESWHVDTIQFKVPVAVAAVKVLDGVTAIHPAIPAPSPSQPDTFELKVFYRPDASAPTFRGFGAPIQFTRGEDGIARAKSVVTDHLIISGKYKCVSIAVYGVRAEDIENRGDDPLDAFSESDSLTFDAMEDLSGLVNNEGDDVDSDTTLYSDELASILQEKFSAAAFSPTQCTLAPLQALPEADASRDAVDPTDGYRPAFVHLCDAIIGTLGADRPPWLEQMFTGGPWVDENHMHDEVGDVGIWIGEAFDGIHGGLHVVRAALSLLAALFKCSSDIAHVLITAGCLTRLHSLLQRAESSGLLTSALETLEASLHHAVGVRHFIGDTLTEQSGYQLILSIVTDPVDPRAMVVCKSLLREGQLCDSLLTLNNTLDDTAARSDPRGNGVASACTQALLSLSTLLKTERAENNDRSLPFPPPGDLSPQFMRHLQAFRLIPHLLELLVSPEVGVSSSQFALIYGPTRDVILELLSCRRGLLYLSNNSEATAMLIRLLAGSTDMGSIRFEIPAVQLTRQTILNLLADAASLVPGAGFPTLAFCLRHPEACQPLQLSMLILLHCQAMVALDQLLSLPQWSPEQRVVLHILFSMTTNRAGEAAVSHVLGLNDGIPLLLDLLSPSDEIDAKPVWIQYAVALLHVLLIADSNVTMMTSWGQSIAERLANLASTHTLHSELKARIKSLCDWVEPSALWKTKGVSGLLKFLEHGVTVIEEANREIETKDTEESLSEICVSVTSTMRMLNLMTTDTRALIDMMNHNLPHILTAAICASSVTISPQVVQSDAGSKLDRERRVVAMLIPTLEVYERLLISLMKEKLPDHRGRRLFGALLNLYALASERASTRSTSVLSSHVAGCAELCHKIIGILRMFVGTSWTSVLPDLFDFCLSLPRCMEHACQLLAMLLPPPLSLQPASDSDKSLLEVRRQVAVCLEPIMAKVQDVVAVLLMFSSPDINVALATICCKICDLGTAVALPLARTLVEGLQAAHKGAERSPLDGFGSLLRCLNVLRCLSAKSVGRALLLDGGMEAIVDSLALFSERDSTVMLALLENLCDASLTLTAEGGVELPQLTQMRKICAFLSSKASQETGAVVRICTLLVRCDAGLHLLMSANENRLLYALLVAATDDLLKRDGSDECLILQFVHFISTMLSRSAAASMQAAIRNALMWSEGSHALFQRCLEVVEQRGSDASARAVRVMIEQLERPAASISASAATVSNLAPMAIEKQFQSRATTTAFPFLSNDRSPRVDFTAYGNGVVEVDLSLLKPASVEILPSKRPREEDQPADEEKIVKKAKKSEGYEFLSHSFRQPKNRRDTFRTRKPNTSRPPSKHVDEYQKDSKDPVIGASSSGASKLERRRESVAERLSGRNSARPDTRRDAGREGPREWRERRDSGSGVWAPTHQRTGGNDRKGQYHQDSLRGDGGDRYRGSSNVRDRAPDFRRPPFERDHPSLASSSFRRESMR